MSVDLINIIFRSTGVGIDRDAALAKEIIGSAGISSVYSHSRDRFPVLSMFLPVRRRFRANLFLERAFPAWFRCSPVNLLIPNQERFPHRHLRRLRHIDSVLCKTRHAEQIFRDLGVRTRYIGFTSHDRLIPQITPDYSTFFHLAGRSTVKGTETLLRLWWEHRHWPVLTLVQHPQNAPPTVPPNVRLIRHVPSDDELQILQNTCGVHLCPSRCEGWGHYLAEAASCRALVLTTDAPPMNELITIERGLLVPWDRSEPRHLGTNFFVNPAQLAEAIEKSIAMPLKEKSRIGQQARLWFEQNDRRFRMDFPRTIEELTTFRC